MIGDMGTTSKAARALWKGVTRAEKSRRMRALVNKRWANTSKKAKKAFIEKLNAARMAKKK
jgi:hypothetical protein